MGEGLYSWGVTKVIRRKDEKKVADTQLERDYPVAFIGIACHDEKERCSAPSSLNSSKVVRLLCSLILCGRGRGMWN